MPNFSAKQMALINESNREFNVANQENLMKQTKRIFNDIALHNTAAHEANKVYLKTFGDILGEKRTIAKGDGLEKDITIDGIDDLRINVLEPHTGRPWQEVARDAHAQEHFAMYAISKGVSIWDIQKMLKEPDSLEAAAIKEKIVGLRDDYIKMIVTEDTEKIKQTMIDYMLSMKKELPTIYDKISSFESARENINALRAIGSIHAYFIQDYPHVEDEKYKDTMSAKFKVDVDKTLEDMGEDISMDKIYVALVAPNYYVTKFWSTTNGIFNDIDEDSETIDSASVAMYVDEFRRSFLNSVNKTNTLGEAMSDFLPKFLETDLRARGLNASDEEEWIDADRDLIDSLCTPKFDPNEASDYLEKLNNNKRTNIFGVKKEDSDLYTAVKDNLQRYINAKKSNLNMDRSALEALKESCEKYLETREPSQKDGKARYKLIHKVYMYAKQGLCNTKNPSYEKLAEFEKANKKSADEGKVVSDAYAEKGKKIYDEALNQAESSTRVSVTLIDAIDKREKLANRPDMLASYFMKRMISNQIKSYEGKPHTDEVDLNINKLKEKLTEGNESEQILESKAFKEVFAKLPDGPYDAKKLDEIFHRYLEKASGVKAELGDNQDKELVGDDKNLNNDQKADKLEQNQPQLGGPMGP